MFHLKLGTTVEHLPDGALLFSAQDQQIHRLNESSGILAKRLLAPATEHDLAAELSKRGVAPGAADEWVSAFLTETASLGLLRADRPALPATAPEQRIHIYNRILSLRYGTGDLEQLLAPDYAHLQVNGASVDGEITLSTESGFVFIGNGAGPTSVAPQASAAIRLKGLILEDVLAQPDHLVALHSACLERKGQALLLLGPPGAGKTTLSLALMNLGYRYGSDDVTMVREDGRVKGVPLAPGFKESAWPIAKSLGADLSALPVHFRPDGQRVRFMRLAEQLAESCPVSVVIRLRRSADERAALNPIAASEGLAELFRESRSRDGKCSPEILHALVGIVSEAECFELRYSEAAEAASLIPEQTTQ